MNGSVLRFYIHENHKCNRKLAYQWLLDKASTLGIENGNAFRAFAGFRGAHELHKDDQEASIMDLTVVVEFVVTNDQADSLTEHVRQLGLPVLLTRASIQMEQIAGK